MTETQDRKRKQTPNAVTQEINICERQSNVKVFTNVSPELSFKRKKKTIYGHSLKNHMRWDKTINILKDTDRQTTKKVNMVWTEQQCVWLRVQMNYCWQLITVSAGRMDLTHTYTHTHTHTHMHIWNDFFLPSLTIKGFFFAFKTMKLWKVSDVYFPSNSFFTLWFTVTWGRADDTKNSLVDTCSEVQPTVLALGIN